MLGGGKKEVKRLRQVAPIEFKPSIIVQQITSKSFIFACTLEKTRPGFVRDGLDGLVCLLCFGKVLLELVICTGQEQSAECFAAIPHLHVIPVVNSVSLLC